MARIEEAQKHLARDIVAGKVPATREETKEAHRILGGAGTDWVVDGLGPCALCSKPAFHLQTRNVARQLCSDHKDAEWEL